MDNPTGANACHQKGFIFFLPTVPYVRRPLSIIPLGPKRNPLPSAVRVIHRFEYHTNAFYGYKALEVAAGFVVSVLCNVDCGDCGGC